MSTKIQLSPEELIAQSDMLLGIMDGFDGVFGNITQLLKTVNGNWSENLANNFLGKITSAQNGFAEILNLLQTGAQAARNSAEKYISIDQALANLTNKLDDIPEHAVRLAEQAADFVTDKIEDGIECFGAGVVAVKSAVSNAAKSVINSYENHGWAYDTWEYGKCVVKGVSAVVKIVGAAVSIGTGAGIPVGIISAISAVNDLTNMHADWVYISNNNYDLVGKTNVLKDYLTENAGMIGEYFGNRELGEFLGKLTYFGVDLVTFLNGADEMIKNFGKLNVDLYGTAGYSWILGKTSFDDILEDGYSTGRAIWQGIKDVRSTIIDAINIGKDTAELRY